MNFEVKKTENCFSNTQTYEYRLPIENQAFLQYLQAYQIKTNEKLRRPVFSAVNGEGVQLKGILRERICKVSFSDDAWEQLKMEFEQFLESLAGGER